MRFVALLVIGSVLVFGASARLQAQDVRAQGVEASTPSPDLVAAVEAFLKPHDAEMPRFEHATPDLDDDGRADAVVYLLGSDWCGTGGCTLLVFHRTEKGLRFVSDSILTRLPIRLSPEKMHGWHTLLAWARDVGDVVMPFDGKAYPGSPADQPKASAAQIARSELILNSGPSYICGMVPEESLERVICDDRELSRLDQELAAVYRAAVEAAGSEGSPKLEAAQRDWTAGRDRCWNSENERECTRTAYRKRIAALRTAYGLSSRSE